MKSASQHILSVVHFGRGNFVSQCRADLGDIKRSLAVNAVTRNNRHPTDFSSLRLSTAIVPAYGIWVQPKICQTSRFAQAAHFNTLSVVELPQPSET